MSRYKIHWAKEALAKPPPIKWIIENLIGRETLTVFYGESGSKKTYSLLDLCVCVAMGNEWIGFPTTQTNVLVIDEESGEPRMQRRLHEVMHGHDARDIPLAYVCMPQFNLMRAADRDEIADLIHRTKTEFVLIDAMVDVMPGADENSAKDTAVMFQNLKALVHSLHVVIVLIHHTNRSGGYRGSSNIKGQVDLMIEVESKSASSDISFRSEKTRDSELFAFSALAHFESELFYLSSAEEQPPRTITEQYILDILKKAPRDLKYLERSVPASVKATAIRPAIQRLVTRGCVQRLNKGAQGATAIYGLPSQSMNLLDPKTLVLK